MDTASILDRARDIGETYAECAHDEPAAHPLTHDGVRAFLDAETCTGLGLDAASVADAPAAWFADVLESAATTLREIGDAGSCDECAGCGLVMVERPCGLCNGSGVVSDGTGEPSAKAALAEAIATVGDGRAHELADAFAAYCRTFAAPGDDAPPDVIAAYQRAARALDEAAAALREVAG